MTTKTLLALLCLPALAHADTSRSHGAMCAPKYTSKDLVGVDERGMYNGATSGSALVTCMAADRPVRDIYFLDQGGFWGNRQATPSKLEVYGRDLSTTVPFSCYVFMTQDDGFSSWGPTKYMCSQAGGCPDSTTSYTGTNSIAWNVDPFDNGAFGLDAWHADHVGAVCSLPPTTSAGSSYVKSVTLTDNAYTTLEQGSNQWFDHFSIHWE